MTDLFRNERCEVSRTVVPKGVATTGTVVRESRHALYGRCYLVQLPFLDREASLWVYAPREAVSSIEDVVRSQSETTDQLNRWQKE